VKEKRNKSFPLTTILIFLVIAGLVSLASLYPHPWLWGVNWWSGLGTVRAFVCASVVLFIAALTFFLLRSAEKNNSVEPSDIRFNLLWRVIVITVVVFVPILGWIFRAQSFVLGDGYSVIANLKLAVPIIKARNFGGSFIPFILYDLLPGDTDSRARLAYQFYSIGSGVLYVLASAFAVTVLHRSLFNRIAGLLILLTSGNMLLFFGYAENYPLFHVFYLLTCAFGYRFVRDQRSRDALLFFLATLASLVLHVFAVTLIPAAIGTLLPITARRLKWKWIPRPRASTVVAVLVSLVGGLGIYLADRFARMSFLSILPNEFTADNYTLFSLRHFSDTFNLLLLILPGSILLLLKRSKVHKIEDQFLLFVAGSGLGLAFWVNPGLGMPRDWDLLSFCMIPFALWIGSRCLTSNQRVMTPVIVAAVTLNLLILVPRVTSNMDRALMWNHFDRFFTHDPMRNMKFRLTQIVLMREQGFDKRARLVEAEIFSQFPEIEMTRSALTLSSGGKHDLAIQKCRMAISRNPIYSDAYNNLAVGQIGIGQLDSAQHNLDIAAALNPYNKDIINNYAVIAYNQNRLDDAQELFEKSLRYNPEDLTIRINLLQVAYSLRDSAQARIHGQWLRGRLYLPPKEMVETIKIFAVLGLNDLGREFLEDALEKGMDTTSARTLIERFPGLR
jgi:hypothetical protein